MTSLTEDQRRRMEESRRKALALRAAKQQQVIDRPSAPSTLSPAHRAVVTSSPRNHQTGRDHPVASSTGFYPKTAAKTLVQSFTSQSESRKQATAIGQRTLPSAAIGSSPYTKPQAISSRGQPQTLHQKSRDHSVQTSVNADSSPGKNFPLSSVKGKCVLVSRERFQVDVGYSAALVEIFKSMISKQYDPVTKKWCFHLSEYSKLMQHIRGLGGQVSVEPLPRSVLSAFSHVLQGKVSGCHVTDADLSAVDGKLVATLMPFQRDGVNFAIYHQGRVLIADDMGLGKTLQALCVASYYRSEWPLLVVVPSSVRFAWREQILAWLPSVDPQTINVVVSGKESSTSGHVNIISYDLMVKHKEELREAGFRVIVMDESHSLKNVKTARTQAALPLLKRAKRVILLSGTPALSRPNELFTQISAIDSTIFPKFHDFGIRYCDGKKHPWGWDFSGSSNLAELQLILEEKIMIRRLKRNVMSQLPSKCRQMVILDPGSVKINKTMQNTHKLVDKMKGAEKRGALLDYFHVTGSCKVKAVREYVLELLEADRKLLVFAHHQEVLDAIEESVVNKKYGFIRIDGRTPSEQRSYLAGSFQADERVRLAILSITAANAGLNLTAASLVVFAELFWNPGILMQAEDRAHRIGQADNVTVHYLVAKGTADDYVWPLVQQKLQVLGRAGLSKDDFSQADTKIMQDPKQREIMEYFERSFIEDFDEEMTEVTQTKQEVAQNRPEVHVTDPTKQADRQNNLFHYFQAPTSKRGVTNNNNESPSENYGNEPSHVIGGERSADVSVCSSESGRNLKTNEKFDNKQLSSEISGGIYKEDYDWLDELDEEFWEDGAEQEAPWPPRNKKAKLCS